MSSDPPSSGDSFFREPTSQNKNIMRLARKTATETTSAAMYHMLRPSSPRKRGKVVSSPTVTFSRITTE